MKSLCKVNAHSIFSNKWGHPFLSKIDTFITVPDGIDSLYPLDKWHLITSSQMKFNEFLYLAWSRIFSWKYSYKISFQFVCICLLVTSWFHMVQSLKAIFVAWLSYSGRSIKLAFNFFFSVCVCVCLLYLLTSFLLFYSPIFHTCWGGDRQPDCAVISFKDSVDKTK